MNETVKDYFFYSPRYKSFSEKKECIIRNIKCKILSFSINNRILRKRFNEYEIKELSNLDWIDEHKYYKRDIQLSTKSYNNISLEHIIFFEVIEIDNFENFSKKALSKIISWNNQNNFNKSEIEDKLSNIKIDLGTIKWGELFNIHLNKTRSNNNDLIDTVKCRYIKTSESYYILRFSITLSKKAHQIFNHIVNQNDILVSQPYFNSFWKIILKNRFYSREKLGLTLKHKSTRNLISDINSQIVENFTKHFNGYFTKSKIFRYLPSIELYCVKDIKELKYDRLYRDNFETFLDIYYSSSNGLTEMYFPKDKTTNNELIQIIKQETNDKIDISDFSNTGLLLDSISFPCVFSAILTELNHKLKGIKRTVYDQINESNSKNYLWILKFIRYNNSYLSLKKKLIQILLSINRLESEFTKSKIESYIRDYDLNDFSIEKNCANINGKLKTNIIKNIDSRITILNEKTQLTDKIFKSLEELNNYRTNFSLQITSIIIALLALAFTFNLKDLFLPFIKNIIEYVNQIF